MRKLNTGDIFAAARLLKQLGLKEAYKTAALQSDDTREASDKGYELLWSLFDKGTEENGQEALYIFLAGVFEMSPAEVNDLPAADFLSALKQLAEENDLVSFFKSAGKVTK